MKAMLLAAGRGSRLKPLTNDKHKSLLSVGEGCLIEHNILKLRAAGVRDIVINVHYLAEQVMQFLGDGSRYAVNIQYAIEQPECLGTGGGVYHALPLLGDAPFWLLSADIWSDFSLPSLELGLHTDMHLVMVNNPSFHPEGDYSILPTGRLSFSEPRCTFSGISLLHPKIFRHFSPGVFQLGNVFQNAIMAGVATGELYAGSWFNVGTQAQLQQLRQHLQSPFDGGVVA